MNKTYCISDMYVDFKEYKKEYLEDIPFSKTDFSKIICEFNRIISERILNGHEYHIGCGALGSIKIIKCFRNDGNIRISWPETNKYKKKLLNEGKELYKEWKNDNGEVVNNGGEKYIIYDTSKYYYLWVWDSLSEIPNVHFLNEDNEYMNKNHLLFEDNWYKFIPVFHNFRAISKYEAVLSKLQSVKKRK